MPDNHKVIASTLTDNKLATAFVELAGERWDNWDLSPWMAYLVDICAPAILPYLADQFDVEGLQGFSVAENEEQQRDLIKKSLALHKYIGTPWAIREACRTVGFPIVYIEEGVTELDGIYRDEDWARFNVYLKAFDERYIPEIQTRKLRLFVESYKNIRSHLVDFGLQQSFSDEPVFTLDEEKDESLEVFYIELTPNPVMLNPTNAPKTVTVNSNANWQIGSYSSLWNDGTGDRITVTKTATNEITIISDSNQKADREVLIPIVTNTGLLLDTLRIIQYNTWHNAYSSGYSRAYNWNDYK